MDLNINININGGESGVGDDTGTAITAQSSALPRPTAEQAAYGQAMDQGSGGDAGGLPSPETARMQGAQASVESLVTPFDAIQSNGNHETAGAGALPDPMTAEAQAGTADLGLSGSLPEPLSEEELQERIAAAESAEGTQGSDHSPEASGKKSSKSKGKKK